MKLIKLPYLNPMLNPESIESIVITESMRSVHGYTSVETDAIELRTKSGEVWKSLAMKPSDAIEAMTDTLSTLIDAGVDIK